MDAFADWLYQEQPSSSRLWLKEDLQVSNILLFNESLSVETKSILNADLVPWVDGFASSGDRDSITGVTRIVWMVRDYETTFTKLSSENLRYLFDHFELQRARNLVRYCLEIWGEKLSPTKKQSFALRYHGGLAMAWNYDFLTNKTEAVFEGGLPWSLTLQDVIQSQQRLGLHPLFMGLVVVMAALRDLMDKFHNIDVEIGSVESRTRHNVMLTGRAAAGSYTFLSTKMSGQAQAAALCEEQHALMLQNLDWLSEFQWPQDVERPSWLARVAEGVDECSHLLRKSLKTLEPHMRLLSKRADIQLTALFNLISQEENRLSRFVAQDSRTLASATKDDSTAMKTLAAVTVVFLPGTFVAALFSMPLFQWDTRTKPHSAISEQFWIYWATTLPLTILTLALWFAWMRLQTRRHRARDKKDREELDLEVDNDSRESLGRSYSSLASNEGSKTSLRSHRARSIVPDAPDHEIDDISLRSLGSRHSLPASNARSVTSLQSHGAENAVPETEKGPKQA